GSSPATKASPTACRGPSWASREAHTTASWPGGKAAARAGSKRASTSWNRPARSWSVIWTAQANGSPNASAAPVRPGPTRITIAHPRRIRPNHRFIPIPLPPGPALPGVDPLEKHRRVDGGDQHHRSEEHTSELQSRENLVCRLLLEKKK